VGGEETMMKQALWFETALLPGGWEQGVGLTIVDGLIASIDIGVPAAREADRHGVAIPGLPNLHSHAFQRAMAGLTEQRGETADSFWTWRDLMYRFAQRLDPETMQAVAALAFVEMLETGFTRSGEFHYIHHQPSGQMFDDPGEMSASIAAAAADTGIGLTLLPVFYAAAGFGGASPSALQRRFVSTLDGFEALVGGAERAIRGLPDGVVFAPCLRIFWRRLRACASPHPFTSTSPSRSARSRTASRGAAVDPSNGCSARCRWMRAGAWFTPLM
jgi:formimidoylglutamate deiminase